MNKRLNDRKMYRYIRNTVIGMVVTCVPVLYGMGILPAQTVKAAIEEHKKMTMDIDARWDVQAMWYNKVEEEIQQLAVSHARVETQVKAIHDNVERLLNRTGD